MVIQSEAHGHSIQSPLVKHRNSCRSWHISCQNVWPWFLTPRGHSRSNLTVSIESPWVLNIIAFWDPTSAVKNCIHLVVFRLPDLIANIFGTKHEIDNRAMMQETTRGPLHRLETSWTLAHKRRKTEPKFLPTLRKFCILLHCRLHVYEVGKQNTTKLCDMLEAKPICKCVL